MNNILFITYDGLCDPLGQSQILPYVKGLTKILPYIKGLVRHYKHRFTILSAEKQQNFVRLSEDIAQQLEEYHINWEKIVYTKRPPVLSTIWDIFKLKNKAGKLHKLHKFNIVHCRSYIASFAGLMLKKKYGVKFIFDMRAFYADERVDGNIWNRKNIIFNLIYKYFKKKEIEFLTNADYTVCLTNAAKKIIFGWKPFVNFKPPIEVIPCCVDTDLFDPVKITNNQKELYRNKLGILPDDFVISYIGSTGTWYLPDEMLAFFKELSGKRLNAKFLIITKDVQDSIIQTAKKHKIAPDKLIITCCEREEVPVLLGFCNISIFFIKPAFSKKASSPTKFAEILAMGIPVICNSGVGDIDDYFDKFRFGILINDFTKESYSKVIEQISDAVGIHPDYLRKQANQYFGLKHGINLYNSVYGAVY
ncbi:MAG: glycosyltransferase [Bacteroidia bacterium]|nr:glycosyltransferase [Bacteroidia bacterium]